MSKEKFFLNHIIESIDLIKDYLSNVTMQDFYSSISTQDMIYRRLEIIGEAVKNLSLDFKTKYPDVNWKRSLACAMSKFIIISELIQSLHGKPQ